jgi:hypothetical protein
VVAQAPPRRFPVFVLLIQIAIIASASPAALSVDVLTSTGGIPAHIAGRFRNPIGFQQSTFGQYFIFDRRAHAVFGIDEALERVWEIIRIGAEPGRIIDPTAFACAPDGTFVVADAPNNRERIQIFSPVGFRIGGFFLPGRVRARVMFENLVLNGIGTLQYTGTSILMSWPETGGLVTEFELGGAARRTFGLLRQTGHEDDRELHLALNSGMPLVDPTGGFYFVFQTGDPVFRKYDREGRLLFERRMQGRELDSALANLPAVWPTRKTDEGELPLVQPTIRTAAVDYAGNLWVSFVVPYTYVFDRDGDKMRTIQFRAAGIVAPNGLFFGKNGRILVTPGLYAFEMAGQAGGAGAGGSAHAPVLPIKPVQPLPPILPILPVPPILPIQPVPPVLPPEAP